MGAVGDAPTAGAIAYALSSNRARLNAFGVPPAGSIGITIEEFSVTTLGERNRGALGAVQDPVALLSDLIRTPTGAVDPASLTAHRVYLAGVPAAGVTSTYAYDGVTTVQANLVSIDGQEIATIQMDADPALAVRGNSVLNDLIADWRWRGSMNPAERISPTPTSLQLAADAAAERLARSAQSAAGAYAKRDNGAYTGLSPTVLHYFDPTIATNIRPRERRTSRSAA